MKNLFGFILFIFLCYWALRGCSGKTEYKPITEHIIDQVDTLPTEVNKTPQIEEKASKIYDDITYCVFKKGEKVLAAMAINNIAPNTMVTLTFNEHDFTPSELRDLIMDYGFVSSSPGCSKVVNIYDWQLPSYIKVDVRYVRLYVAGENVIAEVK